MWNEIIKNLADYQSAVLTGMDSKGYPFSIRCKPKPDTTTKVLHVQVPEGTDIQPGPAGLLCHKHDELMWNPKSFIVRGTLEQDAQGWILRPRRFIPGMGVGNFVLSLLKFIRQGKRNAKRYLKRRGLPRPEIPWDEINAMWAQIKKNK